MYPLFSNVPFLFPLRLLEKQTLTDFDSFFHHCNTYPIHHFSWSHLLFVTILTEFHYWLQNSDWRKGKIDGFQLFATLIPYIILSEVICFFCHWNYWRIPQQIRLENLKFWTLIVKFGYSEKVTQIRPIFLLFFDVNL